MVVENGKTKTSFPFAWGFNPQEEMLEVSRKTKKLTIGIPKETTCGETRMPLTPEAVKLLTQRGHDVIIEADAGLNANFSNLYYSENGATIVQTPQEVFTADIVIKVSPFSIDEVALMNVNQTIISSLHLNKYTADFIKAVMHKKVTAIASDAIKDADGCYPIVRSMSSIAGSIQYFYSIVYTFTQNFLLSILSITQYTPVLTGRMLLTTRDFMRETLRISQRLPCQRTKNCLNCEKRWIQD